MNFFLNHIYMNYHVIRLMFHVWKMFVIFFTEVSRNLILKFLIKLCLFIFYQNETFHETFTKYFMQFLNPIYTIRKIDRKIT